MKFTTKIDAKRKTGFNYLGSVNKTAKHVKAYKYNELTYALYLAPAKMSGFEVCPMRTKECTALCLNESGMNKGMGGDKINKSRIEKTKLFFNDREFFMEWLIWEIAQAKEKARKNGYQFSVRLNNTSDISPEMFWINIEGKKKNILEIFPDVQFYEYSKVPKYYKLTKKYSNYHLTFSYSGLNEKDCLKMLDLGINVAVVFKDKLPETFWGKRVINGDLFDMRYRDDLGGVIIGLKFKSVRTQPDKDSKFVIH
jgi:hypothetical protein